jgi:hypothetical protein
LISNCFTKLQIAKQYEEAPEYARDTADAGIPQMHRHCVLLGWSFRAFVAYAVLTLLGIGHAAVAANDDYELDPKFRQLRLPRVFTPQRAARRMAYNAFEEVDVLKLPGEGCVTQLHLILSDEKKAGKPIIVLKIYADGVAEPQFATEVSNIFGPMFPSQTRRDMPHDIVSDFFRVSGGPRK